MSEGGIVSEGELVSKIVIIGSGFSGIGMGIALKKASRRSPPPAS